MKNDGPSDRWAESFRASWRTSNAIYSEISESYFEPPALSLAQQASEELGLRDYSRAIIKTNRTTTEIESVLSHTKHTHSSA